MFDWYWRCELSVERIGLPMSLEMLYRCSVTAGHRTRGILDMTHRFLLLFKGQVLGETHWHRNGELTIRSGNHIP